MSPWGCLVVVFMMGTLPGHHSSAPSGSAVPGSSVRGGRPVAAAKAPAPGPAVGQAPKTGGSGVGKFVSGVASGRTASRSKGSSSVSGTGVRTGH